MWNNLIVTKLVLKHEKYRKRQEELFYIKKDACILNLNLYFWHCQRTLSITAVSCFFFFLYSLPSVSVFHISEEKTINRCFSVCFGRASIFDGHMPFDYYITLLLFFILLQSDILLSFSTWAFSCFFLYVGGSIFRCPFFQGNVMICMGSTSQVGV